MKYTEQFTLGKTLQSCAHFLISIAVLLEAPSYFTLCSALLQSSHSHQAFSWGKQWYPLLSMGHPSFFLLQLRTLISLTVVPTVWDLQLLISSLKYLRNRLHFCSNFLLHEFVLFLHEFLIQLWFPLFSYIHQSNPKYFLVLRNSLVFRNSLKVLVCWSHPFLFFRGMRDNLYIPFLLQTGGVMRQLWPMNSEQEWFKPLPDWLLEIRPYGPLRFLSSPWCLNGCGEQKERLSTPPSFGIGLWDG